jgi:hypothetical protein
MARRWHFRASERDVLRALLEGDVVFFEGDDGGGGGSGSDDDPGGSDGDPDESDDDGDPGGSDDKETLSLAEARKLRREARTQRQRAKEAERKLAERESADLSDNERLKNDLQARTERVNELETRTKSLTVRLAAVSVGIPPERAQAAAALVDWEDVDVDDDKEVADALKALKKNHGYLFAQSSDKDKDPPGDIDAGRRDRSKDTAADVKPGSGRLRKAYATS